MIKKYNNKLPKKIGSLIFFLTIIKKYFKNKDKIKKVLLIIGDIEMKIKSITKEMVNRFLVKSSARGNVGAKEMISLFQILIKDMLNVYARQFDYLKKAIAMAEQYALSKEFIDDFKTKCDQALDNGTLIREGIEGYRKLTSNEERIDFIVKIINKASDVVNSEAYSFYGYYYHLFMHHIYKNLAGDSLCSSAKYLQTIDTLIKRLFEVEWVLCERLNVFLEIIDINNDK